MLDVAQTIRENESRLKNNSRTHDPYTGEGCDSIPRKHIKVKDAPTPEMWLPVEMFDMEAVKIMEKKGTIDAVLRNYHIAPTADSRADFWMHFIRSRCEYDFEFWAANFAFIEDKIHGCDITLILKRSQQELNKIVMGQIADKGWIRLIIDKGRQMGLSTYSTALISWLQLVKCKQWHSVICAHVESQARLIRGMYTRILKHYPTWMVGEGLEEITHRPFEGSDKTRYVPCREYRFSVGSSEAPDSLRGEGVKMAHLSEVGLWKASMNKKPEDLVQSIVSAVPQIPLSVAIFESTAKGVGNYFHREFLKAMRGESNYLPVFLAWFFDDAYVLPIVNYEEFITSMSEYEEYLWELGATLEAINWYRSKRGEYLDDWRFKSEFPSTYVESFQSSGHRFYPIELTTRLRKTCCEPKMVGEVLGKGTIGDKECLEDLHFKSLTQGNLKVWSLPAEDVEVNNRYVVSVDIGGRSDKADRSVICVFDRYWMSEGDVPEVVAEWAGHTEHYKVAWLAAQIAKYYHNALLVIESNTLEMERTEGAHNQYILDEISDVYENLYTRPTSPDKIKEDVPARFGFQTNHSTKTMVCDFMLKMLDTDPYVERCSEAVDEFDTFEVKANGKLDAVEGCHDDRHITRAIGLWICYKEKAPTPIEQGAYTSYSKRIVGEASI